MSTKELEYELDLVKSTLQQLQTQVDRMNRLVHTATPIRWLALIGTGKEIWRGVDVDAYINAERDSWN